MQGRLSLPKGFHIVGLFSHPDFCHGAIVCWKDHHCFFFFFSQNEEKIMYRYTEVSDLKISLLCIVLWYCIGNGHRFVYDIPNNVFLYKIQLHMKYTSSHDHCPCVGTGD